MPSSATNANGRDWNAFEGAAGCLGIATAPAEQEQVLTWAAGDLMAGERGGEEGQTVVLVIDDLLNLLSRADLADPLAEIASMGAGLGIHLLAGTQEAGSKRGTGGAGVENNATARILYRNSNAAAAARATGQGAAGLQELSGAKGDALLLLDGEPVRIATGLADDRAILQLEQGAGWLRPWLRSSGPQAPATGHNQGEGAQPGVAPPIDDGRRQRRDGGRSATGASGCRGCGRSLSHREASADRDRGPRDRGPAQRRRKPQQPLSGVFTATKTERPTHGSKKRWRAHRAAQRAI